MKELHLLCNAHLDPVWQWQWQEGAAEAISTFRVAARFCEEYEGFVFNHNEALLYEWVEEYESELFEKIKELVSCGKWHIMGGWYLQPDCLMLSGESFIRQIEAGNKYFMEKFGVKAVTAINTDPFGHTRGLVQIMKKAGYENYIFMRPNDIIEERDFIWKGYDGSEIIGHNIVGGYNTFKGKITSKLEDAISNAYDADANLMLWGIGNHGGGPSEVDINLIEDFKKKHPELDIIHSWCENYFSKVDREKLRIFDESLVHCHVGCYTTMARIKQLHRRLENELIVCEKMLSMSAVEYDREELVKAEKALMFCQFHDVLPGSAIKAVEEDSVRLLNYGLEIVSKLSFKAFLKLCGGQPEGKSGEIPVLVYNPNPYPVETVVEVGFMLEDQNWNIDEVTVARVRDENGSYLPVQNEKEASSIRLDWSKKIAFNATLKPMSINRFDCEFEIEKGTGSRRIEECCESDTHFIVENESMTVAINKKTGLIDKYCVDNTEYLLPESGKILAYRDNEDPWGMTVDGFYDCIGEFTAVSDEEANCFNGYPDEVMPNVRVIENGPVRCKIQAVLKNEKSYAVVTYTIPKKGRYVDVKIKMNTNEPMRIYKLSFNTAFKKPQFVGQTAFGREKLVMQEKEAVYQKWCGMHSGTKGFSVINKGTYGGSAKENVMNISLLRTAICCAHPLEGRPTSYSDRNNDYIDMGEREFEFRLTSEMEYIDAEAEIYNQPVNALSFFPSGGKKSDKHSVRVENLKIILTRCKKIEGEKLMVRLFNSDEKEASTKIFIDNSEFFVSLSPFEFNTYVYDGTGFSQCPMFET